MVKQTKRTTQKREKYPCREYTIHIHKHVHGVSFKRRARTAVQAVRRFARKTMHTRKVRIDVGVNKFLWSRGIKNPPHRIRVRLTRKRSCNAESPRIYTLVEYVPCADFKGLQTVNVKPE